MADTITPEAVEKTVYEALPQFGADESQITREATFEELDVDSLDLAELSQIIEDEYGVAAQGRRRRQDQDRRRRDRPGGEPRRHEPRGRHHRRRRRHPARRRRPHAV